MQLCIWQSVINSSNTAFADSTTLNVEGLTRTPISVPSAPQKYIFDQPKQNGNLRDNVSNFRVEFPGDHDAWGPPTTGTGGSAA